MTTPPSEVTDMATISPAVAAMPPATAQYVVPPARQVLPLLPGAQAGSATGGGLLGHFHGGNLGRMLLFGAAGAMIGCVVPIPGGPVVGVLLGAFLATR